MTRSRSTSSVLALVVLAAAAALVGTARGAPAGCVAGVHTVDGKQARVFCGPAKATIHLGGKTLAVSGGQCDKSSFGYSVNIGTFFAGNTTSKRPYFGIAVEKSKAGTYARQTLAFRINGVTRSSIATITLKPGLRAGTFSGAVVGGGTVTGSFTC